MGAGAVNQCVKGIIIARSILSKKAINTDINMGFKDTEETYDDGKPKSIILFVLKKY